MSNHILVTGATGFLGRALVSNLATCERFLPRAASREYKIDCSGAVEKVPGFELAEDADWRDSVSGVKVVIHTAARVHIMNETAHDPLSEYRRANVEGTLSLARQAAEAGVVRFVFISSIKVNGENTSPGEPFIPDAPPEPQDPYGTSKMEAEQRLRELAEKTGMEVVIIRPPLVYGPGVKANFLNMMRWLHKGVPLPFGAIHNQRSLVALNNIVDLIVTCIDHPAAANQTFLVSDGEDLSTTELLQRLGCALGKPARLFPVSSWLLEIGAKMIGNKSLSKRLCGSLQVDISKTRELLNWAPPVSVDEALRRTAKHFLEQQTR